MSRAQNSGTKIDLSRSTQSLNGLLAGRGRLVLRVDGCGLSGLIAVRRGSSIDATATARSESADASTALEEVLEELRSAGSRIPREVVVQSAAAISTILELPVDPASPRSPAEMTELIRWELEPAFMERAAMARSGSKLIAHGVMDVAAVRSILKQQCEGATFVNPSTGTADVFSDDNDGRFGDLVVRGGLAPRDTVERHVSSVDDFEDEELVCGYSPLSPSSEGAFRWAAVGAPRRVVDDWRSRLSTAGLQLVEVAAIAGSGVPLLPIGRPAILLEYHPEASCLVTVAEDGMQDLQWLDPTTPDEFEAVVQRVCDDPSLAEGTIQYTVGDQTYLGATQSPLTDSKELDLGSSRVPPEYSSLLGVATLSLTLADRQSSNQAVPSLPLVNVRPPREPLLARSDVRVALAAALLLAVVAGGEFLLAHRSTGLSARLEEVKTELQGLSGALRNVEAHEKEGEEVEQALLEARTQLDGIETKHRFLTAELPARSAFVRALLLAVGEEVSEDVIVYRLRELSDHGVHISGWAMSDAAANAFGQGMVERTSDWRTTTDDPVISREKGPLGLAGYSFALTLRATDTDGAKDDRWTASTSARGSVDG